MINLFKPHVPPEVDAPLLATLHSGYITQGEKVLEFEARFGDYIHNPYCVAVNSGTSALTLALRLCNLKKNDEVITTPMTCSATNLPILSLGATPVFADIDPKTGLIDPASIRNLVTKKTKAIMVCDWGGAPVDIEAIRRVAPGVKIIEDAAHAIGASYGEDMIGVQADFTCFSFQAIKHITTVDGGMLVCSNSEDFKRARLLRWFGIDRDNNAKDSRISEDITEWGYKFHMNDVAATIGIEQLNHVKSVVASHRANAMYYNRSLPKDKISLPALEGSSYWLYTLVFPNKVVRDKFKNFMLDNDIQVSQVHRRNDLYTVFKPYATRHLPNTTSFSNTMICIPVNWSLTSKELALIVAKINKFVEVFAQWF